jgi:hypothetical protein
MQTPLSLRQHGISLFICTPRGHPVFALAERKNETQKEDKVSLCNDHIWATM